MAGNTSFSSYGAIEMPFNRNELDVLRVLNTIIVVVGLTGNTYLIYTATYWNALRVNTTSKLFIMNIAIADVLLLVVQFVPMLVTVGAGGKWVLGQMLCHVTGTMARVPLVYECLCTVAFSLYRVYVVRRRQGGRGVVLPKHKLKVVNGAVILATLCVYVSIAVTCRKVRFTPRIMTCFYVITRSVRYQIMIITYAMLVFVTVTLIANGILIFYICSRTYRASHQMSCTMIVVSLSFLASYLPITLAGAMPSVTYKIQAYILVYFSSVNSFINPFIYYATNKYFRHHVQTSLRDVLQPLVGLATSLVSRWSQMTHVEEAGLEKAAAKCDKKDVEGGASVMAHSMSNIVIANPASSILHRCNSV